MPPTSEVEARYNDHMAKDGTQDRMKRETSKTNARIAGAYEKLATKFRERMQKADDKAQAAEKKGKQETLCRLSVVR